MRLKLELNVCVSEWSQEVEAEDVSEEKARKTRPVSD